MRDYMGTFYRDALVARVRYEITRETHVVVGDHEPEQRAARPCRFGRTPACAPHGHSCSCYSDGYDGERAHPKQMASS